MEMKITLETLTPLWTGGTDQTTDRLHETGLLGSLRWWYEALVRGLGGYACDPTSEDPKARCEFDTKAYEKAKKDGKSDDEAIQAGLHNVCPVCYLFGTTGWARRFRLSVSASKIILQGPDGKKQPSGKRFKKNSTERPSWYFRKGFHDTFTLSVLPTHKEFDLHFILGMIKLIEHHAGFGAKTQLGYGWVQIEKVEGATFSANNFIEQLRNIAHTKPGKSNGLPNLQEMFFARVKTNDPDITATLNLRYDVRARFRTSFSNNQRLRHWVCGTVSGEREASKIFFSQNVNGVMRVWGWIPELPADFQITRDQVLEEIKQAISSFGQIVSWREFNSNRDTRGKLSDISEYLLSLLEER